MLAREPRSFGSALLRPPFFELGFFFLLSVFFFFLSFVLFFRPESFLDALAFVRGFLFGAGSIRSFIHNIEIFICRYVCMYMCTNFLRACVDVSGGADRH